MKIRNLLLFLLPSVLLSAASPLTPQQQYIQQYATLAVSEMYRTGVPASITLAQGLLESRYGLSSLAKDGNNHFGIKCHDWKGRRMFVDDDKKGECFRVYDDAAQSFMDHSDFLRYRDRYKFLFDYPTTDYKAWSYGLKKAGYATDPAYPQKLINYIEDYRLFEYDKMTVVQAEQQEQREQVAQASPSAKPGKATKKDKTRKRKKTKTSRYIDDTRTEIAPPPLAVEEPKKISRENVREQFRVQLKTEMYSRNGVPTVRAVPGQTLSSIADQYKLFDKELMRFNDLEPGQEIRPGDIVYLQRKKKQAARGLEKYIVDHDGESLWEISQRFGIRLSTLRKLNGFEADHQLREGDTVVMRDDPLIRKIFRKK